MSDAGGIILSSVVVSDADGIILSSVVVSDAGGIVLTVDDAGKAQIIGQTEAGIDRGAVQRFVENSLASGGTQLHNITNLDTSQLNVVQSQLSGVTLPLGDVSPRLDSPFINVTSQMETAASPFSSVTSHLDIGSQYVTVVSSQLAHANNGNVILMDTHSLPTAEGLLGELSNNSLEHS